MTQDFEIDIIGATFCWNTILRIKLKCGSYRLQLSFQPKQLPPLVWSPLLSCIDDLVKQIWSGGVFLCVLWCNIHPLAQGSTHPSICPLPAICFAKIQPTLPNRSANLFLHYLFKSLWVREASKSPLFSFGFEEEEQGSHTGVNFWFPQGCCQPVSPRQCVKSAIFLGFLLLRSWLLKILLWHAQVLETAQLFILGSSHLTWFSFDCITKSEYPEKTHTGRENMQRPHSKTPNGQQIQTCYSSCERLGIILLLPV